jgi:hypothetical protein
MTASALSPPTAPTSLTAAPEQERRHRRRGPRRRWLNRPLTVVLSIAVTAAGIGVGACGAGRAILGTNTSPCFLALPVAKRAVAGRGSLDGVRLVDVARLTGRGNRALRELLDLMPIPASHEVCLVAYRGSFTVGQVELPFGPIPPSGVGRYAIAVVTIPGSVLLGTLVVQHEPLSFKHEHLGF